MELTNYEWLFVGEYLVDFNATQAIKRAGYVGKYAGQEGWRVLKIPRVAEQIELTLNAIKQKQNVTVEMIVGDAVAVLNADPRELVTMEMGACRYCYGRDHLRQYTDSEQGMRRKLYQTTNEWLKQGIPFDNEGGVGYDSRAEPVEDCPECNGRGVEHVVARDARQIPPDAAKLLAGYKMGKHGLEVIMRSKEAARDTLAKYLGMNKDMGGAVNVNVTVNSSLANMSDEELEKVARGEQ